MGGDRRTSFIHDTHEHSPECTSRPRLFIHESSLGWIDRSLRTSRPHRTEPGPNTITHQTLRRGQCGNCAYTYSRITKTMRGLWRIRGGHHGCTICWGDHPIHAVTFMGSRNRHFRGNSGSKSSHITPQYRME